MCMILKQISYIHPDKESLFENLDFILNKGEKTAITGDNGCGKSTLLRIMAGQLSPSSGLYQCTETCYYMPQHFDPYAYQTLAEVLNIDRKLRALQEILRGNVAQENFDTLNEEWDIEEKAKEALDRWEIPYRTLFHPFSLLSGGEKTKTFLAGIDLHQPDIVLMDEPTNHLNGKGRENLYRFVQHTSASLVIVSHDRQLLNLLPGLTELTHKKLIRYGGNYDFYRAQKDKWLESMEEKLQSRNSALGQAQRHAKKLAQQKQKQRVRGEQANRKKGIPQILMRSLKDQAENSSARSQEKQTGKIEQLSGEIRELRQSLAHSVILKTDIYSSNLHKGKVLLEAKGINFAYADEPLWKEPLTFRFCSGDRWQLEGDNGSGKTTLIRLITGELLPTTGEIHRSGFRYLYLDQQYSLIYPARTLLQQTEEFNHRKLPENELKTILNRYLFPSEVWNKPCGQLSGGEKMRLILCCLQVSERAPDLLILDEPTNNLDIRSMEILAGNIQDFRGALWVVSHDRTFKEEIGLQGGITL